MRALILEGESGADDTLTVENTYGGSALCTITIDSPWQGDTVSGFGAMCQFKLSREQALELIAHLQERLAAPTTDGG